MDPTANPLVPALNPTADAPALETNPTLEQRASSAPSAADRYLIVRSQIEHEDNLTTERLSWFLASQAFLFSALAILLNAPVQSRFADREMSIFHKLIPIIAIAVGMLIWLAVLAGILTMSHLRATLARQGDLAEFPPIQGPRGMRWMGLAAPVLLPPLFVIVWCVLLAVGAPTVPSSVNPAASPGRTESVEAPLEKPSTATALRP